MKSSIRSYFVVRLLLLLVLLGVGGWAAAKLDWTSILHQLESADLRLEMAMAAAWILALFIRPARMMFLVRALATDVRPRYAPIWSADVAAMAMNSVVPMRAGDIMMTVILGQNLGMTTARSTSVVLVDRFFDFATVVVIFATTFSVVPSSVPWAHQAIFMVVSVLAVLSVGLWLAIHLRGIWLRLLERVFEKVGPRRSERWLRTLRDLLDGFAKLDNPRTVAIVVLFSACQWVVISVSYWCGIAAVWPVVSVPAAGFAAAAVALSFIVPIAPGGFGVFHGAVVLALSLFSVPVEPALAFAIVAHALQMGSVVILGALSLIWQGVSIRSLVTFRGLRS